MAASNPSDYSKASSVYEFTVKDTFGNEVPLKNYEGKVLLIVNIASQCGLTKNNYEKLDKLNKEFHEAGRFIKKKNNKNYSFK